MFRAWCLNSSDGRLERVKGGWAEPRRNERTRWCHGRECVCEYPALTPARVQSVDRAEANEFDRGDRGPARLGSLID